jgi:hypothetical protein
MRKPSTKLILAEVDKRLATLRRRVRGLNPADSQQLVDEALGAIAELEAIHDMIYYRRRSLTTNAPAAAEYTLFPEASQHA